MEAPKRLDGHIGMNHSLHNGKLTYSSVTRMCLDRDAAHKAGKELLLNFSVKSDVGKTGLIATVDGHEQRHVRHRKQGR
jgi:hypothetical protein